MSVKTVNQIFIQVLWGKIFTELWSRPTTIADLRSSFRQIHHTSNVCWLENKIHNWGMYLFAISFRRYAAVQKSGDGRWFEIVVILKEEMTCQNSAKIAPTLKRIIHNSLFKRRVSLEEQTVWKEDNFLGGKKKIAHMIYEYFRVNGANDSVENYADLFTVADIQEFDSTWDGISWSMTKIPHDDILE